MKKIIIVFLTFLTLILIFVFLPLKNTKKQANATNEEAIISAIGGLPVDDYSVTYTGKVTVIKFKTSSDKLFYWAIRSRMLAKKNNPKAEEQRAILAKQQLDEGRTLIIYSDKILGVDNGDNNLVAEVYKEESMYCCELTYSRL